MKNKIKIYLCDLVHDYLGVGTYMFPLNIGYIAAWTNKFFSKDVDIHLFKYPNDFIKQFKKTIPDIVGFSNYTWNADLNDKISRWVKSISPETIVVFGGPNIDYSDEGGKRFFKTRDSADFYAAYQGETPFVILLNEIVDRGFDIARIRDADSIPSPYLTGLLDKFFDTNLIPIAETNRGCPYTCTYCCQGLSSYNQMEFFSLDRIKKELRYITNHVKNTDILLFADSNFGIKDRDIGIAEYLSMLTNETGYPHRVSMNWAKNQPKLFDIAEILNNINLVISLQSLDSNVLKNIKRHNIKISVFKDILNKVNEKGGMSGTELILGLPGETKQSHIEALRELFDWNVSYIICYNCLILEGSELSLMRERGEFECETKFRLIDNSYGKYNDMMSFEFEEGIRSTDTMTEEEILFFRPVHWLIQFLWNYRFYYDLLKYLQSLDINPLDYITKLIDDSDRASSPKVRKIFQQFKKDAIDEWFDSSESLHEYYSRPKNFKWLKEGNYGKMNSKYIFKVLLEIKDDFGKYLYDTAVDMCTSKKEVFKGILDYLSAAIIDFSKDEEEVFTEKTISSQYNILEWKKSRYEKNLEKFYFPEANTFLFSLTSDQEKSLRTLLKQYKHKNRNVTLRKMSEYMDIRDFFRKAELVKTEYNISVLERK